MFFPLSFLLNKRKTPIIQETWNSFISRCLHLYFTSYFFNKWVVQHQLVTYEEV